MNIPVDWSLIVGGISLPVFAQTVLWGLHRVGVPVGYDLLATWLVAAVFAVVVVTLNFYPQYSSVIVGAVTFLYTVLATAQKLLPSTASAIVKSLAASTSAH